VWPLESSTATEWPDFSFADYEMIDRKRRKQMPDFLDHLGPGGGGQGEMIMSGVYR